MEESGGPIIQSSNHRQIITRHFDPGFRMNVSVLRFTSTMFSSRSQEFRLFSRFIFETDVGAPPVAAVTLYAYVIR